MIDLYKTPNNSEKIDPLSDKKIIEQLHSLKEKLKEKVVILGHHYQSDDIVSLSDIVGDSLKLADQASQIDKPYIIFCGVHFMAETADILSSKDQTIILPDLEAGCQMADMANRADIDKAWSFLKSSTSKSIIPITYVNCTADLKSFVGENEGSICTSSNAKKIISWALEKGEKLLFFPDQHLGRNTCVELGVELKDMVVYNPELVNGGVTKEEIEHARVILWYGYCSVHQGFTKDQIAQVKKESPETIIIVHPECSFDVVQNADLNGSTAFILETVKNAAKGSKFAVGTEINLVSRLASTYPDKTIKSLSPYHCLCSTMYRIRPELLLKSMRSIEKNDPINVISVPDDIKINSKIALERMLEVTRREE